MLMLAISVYLDAQNEIDKYNALKVVEFFLESPDVSKTAQNWRGHTALSMAAAHGDISLVDILMVIVPEVSCIY